MILGVTEPDAPARRPTDMTSRRTTRLAFAALVAAVAAGCGTGTGSGTGTGTGGAASERRDELAAHDGQPCPRRLPQADGHGFGSEEPAHEAPTLPEADAAWVCEYEPVDLPKRTSDGGSVFGWRREGRPVEVSGPGLASLEQRVAMLEPADAQRMCTADLGPRWMLVLSREGDLTGVVVDGYGCRDVRLTDEPFTTVPGEAGAPGAPGIVAGVLAGPEDLLPLLEDAARG
jgi:hypothetical protein